MARLTPPATGAKPPAAEGLRKGTSRLTLPAAGIQSVPPEGGKKVTNIYWDSGTEEIVIVYET